MRLGDYSLSELKHKLAADGVSLHTGPFVARVKSSAHELAEGLKLLYSDVPMELEAECADFHIRIDRPNTV